MLGAADRDPPHLELAGRQPVTPACLLSSYGRKAWRYDFELPVDCMNTYALDGEEFAIDTTCVPRQRIGYASCNGQEREDRRRAFEERNIMWRRLVREHQASPFSLVLYGGDQLYADEVVDAHPTLTAWAQSDLDARARFDFTAEVEAAAERFFLERYQALLSQPEMAYMSARVPALMIWDDHDIVDGWGSRPEPILDSPVGRGIFRVARRMFRLFQLGMGEDVDGAADPSASSVTQCLRFPGLTVVAPDLRSERRPTRVMGPRCWSDFERCLAAARPGDRILVLASVPVLGPRLSWVEKLLRLVPKAQRYEDDLRDQWQSRFHRAEWRRLLLTLEEQAINGRNRIAVLSGEIHLATRAEMNFRDGSVLHQLVSSGIAHPPPPKWYARALGWLASFGEMPIPGQRIELKPPPGLPRIYAPERNYLVLERSGDAWSTEWELETSGRTPALRL